MNFDHIHRIRDLELARVRALMSRHSPSSSPLDILDVGAGSGHQAAGLSAYGDRVTAVDIESSAYAGAKVYPVQTYDGVRLPFEDASFDVVLSSNVLEHVPDLVELMGEVHRVLRPGGIALHVLPTTTWRLWTSLLHPLWIAKRTFQLVTGKRPRQRVQGGDSAHHARSNNLMSMLLPMRHGERGNVVTELWYFSARWWRKTFRSEGWRILEDVSCGIFYSGAMIVEAGLNMRTRAWIATFLGSSTRAYVMVSDRVVETTRHEARSDTQ